MKKQPFNLKSWQHWLAIGLGAGLSPKAPGTVGTAFAIPLVFGLALLPLAWSAVLIIALMVLGVYVSERTSRDIGVEDHGGIVIDEVVGFAITMWALPLSWPWLCAGFVLFRFLDIVKPWPVRFFDQHVTGGLGVMADDLVAGLLACCLLHGVSLVL
ncbi:phosphatidylglycerophosphatase A family protein [Rheinheimera sp.]|uniref:phosphatidylglycerophosphatase A family protein n=1 Tax=Rheinheimera sp. TaxID=1869214 RepID=UPI003D2974DE